MSFNKNVNEYLKGKIKFWMSINSSNRIRNYLGLLNQIGRSKKQQFNFIVYRIRKKMNYWKGKNLSYVCKDILIKDVAQDIPNYTMSVFKFLDILCNKIDNIIYNYWQGARTEERKINWISWSMLFLIKTKGGMGFRKMCIFNNAFLAKQAWRILSNKE